MVRLSRQLSAQDFAAACERFDAAVKQDPAAKPERADLKALTWHLLELLAEKAPGNSVEVRVPPFGVVQVIAGATHRRGTPPAVVETDAVTWIALARGQMAWIDAVSDGRVQASGERSDLSGLLPVVEL